MPRRFRSKTLTTRIEPELCILRTCFCLPWTAAPVTLGCVGGRFDSGGYRRRLAELKADLREALATVELHEKAVAGPVVQAARLALDELEDGLKDVLRQVEQERRHRRQ